MNLYLEVFNTFAKIGAFTLGGGYAMLPLIEEEVVNRKKWIDPKDFIDLVAIAQSAPGIFAVNISIFIGYRLRGAKGSFVASMGSILPSFLIILLIALFFQQFKEIPWVESMFKGIRPAVVALIAAPTFKMAKTAKLNRYTLWIPIVGALLIWLLGISPIWVIVIAGVGGYIYGRFFEGQDEEGHIKTPEEIAREKELERANKEAKRTSKELQKVRETLENSRRKQEKAQRMAEKARRAAEQAQKDEEEALSLMPHAQAKAQKAMQEARRRQEEDRLLRANEPNLFNVLDPRLVGQDNDPANDEDEDE